MSKGFNDWSNVKGENQKCHQLNMCVAIKVNESKTRIMKENKNEYISYKTTYSYI